MIIFLVRKYEHTYLIIYHLPVEMISGMHYFPLL